VEAGALSSRAHYPDLPAVSFYELGIHRLTSKPSFLSHFDGHLRRVWYDQGNEAKTVEP
jgi:hypothetical protein